MTKKRSRRTLTMLGGVRPVPIVPAVKHSKKPGARGGLFKAGQLIPGGKVRQS